MLYIIPKVFPQLFQNENMFTVQKETNFIKKQIVNLNELIYFPLNLVFKNSITSYQHIWFVKEQGIRYN